MKKINLFQNYVSSYKGLPLVCWRGIICTFFNAISIGICFFLSLYFVNNLNFSLTKAGILMSCYGLGTVIGGIVGGKLSDRLYSKTILIISLFLQSLAFVFLAMIHDFLFLLVNLFMLGIAAYGFKTSNNVWMLNNCIKNEIKSKTISISHAASNLGLGVSGVIMAFFSSIEFEIIFYLYGIILFLLAVYMYITNEAINPEIATAVEHNRNEEKVNKKVDKKIILLMILSVFGIGLIIAQLGSTYPIYVEKAFPELGVSAVSILFLLDTTLIVLMQAPLTNFLNGYNKILLVGFGALLMGLGMFFLSVSYFFMLAIISCIFWTFGEMLFVVNSQLVFYEKGQPKKKGQSLGMFQATFAVSNIVGPAVGSVIYQHWSGDSLWHISLFVGIIIFTTCFYYKNYN